MISTDRISTKVPARSAFTVRFTCSPLGEYDPKWPQGCKASDDLGLPSQQFHVVPDRGGQHEERSTPHRPPTTDQFSQRVRSDDTDRGDAHDLLVKDHKMLGTGRLEKHDPKGFHVTTMSRGL